MAAILVVVAGWLTWVIGGGLPTAPRLLARGLATGDVWRLVSWPLADAPSLFGVISLFFFWYFGSDLEGRSADQTHAAPAARYRGRAHDLHDPFSPCRSGGFAHAGGPQHGAVHRLPHLDRGEPAPPSSSASSLDGRRHPARPPGDRCSAASWLRRTCCRCCSASLSAIVARRVGLLGDQGWIPGRRHAVRHGRRPRSSVGEGGRPPLVGPRARRLRPPSAPSPTANASTPCSTASAPRASARCRLRAQRADGPARPTPRRPLTVTQHSAGLLPTGGTPRASSLPRHPGGRCGRRWSLAKGSTSRRRGRRPAQVRRGGRRPGAGRRRDPP